MRISHPWFDRPRRLWLLFAVVTLLPAVGLIWLGSELIRQDEEVARKQLRDDLERQADGVAADISRDLSRPPAAGFVPVAPDDGRAMAMAIRARDLMSGGHADEALSVWAQMSALDDVRVFGDPASLQAGLARVRAFGAANRIQERDREAAEIRSGLRGGRWQVDQTTMETAWTQVAAPEMFVPAWRDRWIKAGIVVHITDLNGNDVVETGSLAEPAPTRSLAESGIPWTLQIASASPEIALAPLRSRRGQLLLVLSLAAFLVMAGAYFVARGMRRELVVAQLQSTFVSAVSHEFRTPLTSMSHLIELLRSRPELDMAKRARYYEALEQEAGRLRRFVDQLLDFGRVDAGKARYAFEATDPRPLVDGIVERFKTGPGARGHVVRCRTNGHCAPVAVDREAFSLALNNVLENAAKYSPVEEPIEVSLESAVATGRITVSVRDYGDGIPKREQQIIFDKFVRGSSAQASNIRGTGVGLALAREIIRAHGGDIRVDSELSKGSTFSIVLPVSPEAAGAP